MANSPLPLLIGAAAAFLILSKKGGGTETIPNIYPIEKFEDLNVSNAQIAVLDSKYDIGVAIIATIPGVSTDQLATAAVGIAKENPKTLFFVSSMESFAPIRGTSGSLEFAVTRMSNEDLTGTEKLTDVTPEMISEKVPAGYNLAVEDLDAQSAQGNAGGTGQRGLAGPAPATNASIMGRRGLASSAPTRNLVSGNWFHRLRASVNV